MGETLPCPRRPPSSPPPSRMPSRAPTPDLARPLGPLNRLAAVPTACPAYLPRSKPTEVGEEGVARTVGTLAVVGAREEDGGRGRGSVNRMAGESSSAKSTVGAGMHAEHPNLALL